MKGKLSWFLWPFRPRKNIRRISPEELEDHLIKTLSRNEGQGPETLWTLSVFYSRMGRIDEAECVLEQAIENTDDLEMTAQCRLGLGQLAEQRHDWDEAIQHYCEVLLLEPVDLNNWYLAHNNLGYCLIKHRKFDKALGYLKTAVEINPDRHNAYKNLGISFDSLGQPEKAVEMFIAAITCEPRDSRALNHLAELLEDNGHLKNEIPDLMKRVEACRELVQIASQKRENHSVSVDLPETGNSSRWWQFWK